MTRVHDFVVDLAKGGKSFKEIKKLVDDVQRDQALKKTQIYEILKRVKKGKTTDDQRGVKTPKIAMTADLITSVSAAVAEDPRVTIQALAKAHGSSFGTISRILHSQLGLVKKSARWVPKLLSQEQMDERVRTSQEFIQLVQTKGRSVLDRIITMDESAVSMHTPETKQQSKQWLKKEWEGVLRGVSKDDFAKAFVRWYERCEKCIRINGSYVEKS
jgi:histone-lysine N-methyltransferase SETMAR